MLLSFRVHSQPYMQSGLMRFILVLFAGFFLTSPVLAQGDFSGCVSQKEMTGIVSANKYIAPTAAVVTARRNVSNADVVRADLCKRGDGYVYVIVALKKDGRAVQVLVNPESGKVMATQ
jgi:hypothetical protein